MKVSICKDPQGFTPRELTLTIETRKEWDALYELTNYNQLVAKTVKKEGNHINEEVLANILLDVWQRMDSMGAWSIYLG